MTTECMNCGGEKPEDRFRACPTCRAAWRKYAAKGNSVLIPRTALTYAIEQLKDMIDGSEECRGRDSQIGHIIGVLENDPWHIHLANQSRRKTA